MQIPQNKDNGEILLHTLVMEVFFLFPYDKGFYRLHIWGKSDLICTLTNLITNKQYTYQIMQTSQMMSHLCTSSQTTR